MKADSLFEELNLLYQQENYKEIIKILKDLKPETDLDYRHYRLLAISYLQTFEYEDALNNFKKCIDSYPKIEKRDHIIVEPLYIFAHKLIKNRQYNDFDKAKDLLLRFNSDYYFFRNLDRKKIYFKDWDKKGYFDKAITLLNYIMEGEKYLRSDIEREKDRDIWEEKCFDSLQRAKEMAGEFDLIWEELGLYYLLLLNFEESEKNLKKAYTMNLGCETIKYNLGILYQERGFYEEAIKYFKEAIDLDKSFKTALNHIRICKSQILANEALAFQRTGKYEQAIEKYQESIKINPNDEKIRKSLNSAIRQYNNKKIELLKELIAKREYIRAENSLNELIKIDPNNSQIKELHYQLLELLHQEDIGKQIALKKENDRTLSSILLSAIEIFRNESYNLTEKFNFLSNELVKLPTEKQNIVANKLSEMGENKLAEEFDAFLCSELNSIGIISSKYIPLKIKTYGQPIDSWLSINIHKKIREIIEKYNFWQKYIPTIIFYDADINQIINEKEIIEEESVIIIDKLIENQSAYQIWILKKGDFIILQTKKYSETIENGKKIKQWIFEYKKADFHDPLIQLHRYEINHNLEIISKAI